MKKLNVIALVACILALACVGTGQAVAASWGGEADASVSGAFRSTLAPGASRAILAPSASAPGALSAQSSSVYDCDVPGMRVEIRDGSQAYVAAFSGSGSLTIPETVTVNGGAFKLVGIGSNAFEPADDEALASVDIPASVKVIEMNAFSGCTQLASVTGCAGLTTIDEDAFAGCEALASFPFGKKLKLIGAHAFDGTAVPASTFPTYLDRNEDGSYRLVDARLYVRGKDNYKYAFKVVNLVNKERAKQGLSKLTMDKDLLKSAMQRAAETAVFFSHTRPNGTDCFTASAKLMEDGAAGENIAAGQWSPASVMTSWMNSPGHRANILDSDFATIGVGCFVVDGQHYWVQMFGASNLSKASKRGNKTVTHAVNYSVDSGKLKLKVSPGSLKKGESAKLKVMCFNGFLSVPVQAKSFKFTSSKPKVLSVNSKGKIKAKRVGKAKVKLAFKRGTVKASKTVKCVRG